MRQLVMLMAILVGVGSAFGDEAASQPVSAPARQVEETARIVAPKNPADYLKQDDIVQAYREKNYALVVQQTGRILANLKVRERYDRFNLLLLRAEAFLQLKNFDMALPAYQAANEAAPDADKKAVMTATVLMLKKRVGLNYPSQTTDEHGAPIYPEGLVGKKTINVEIMDLSKRDAVFRALFWDQAVTVESYIKGIKEGWPSFTEKGMDELDTLSVLETAARGSQEHTDKARKNMAAALAPALTKQMATLKARSRKLHAWGSERILIRRPTPSYRVGDTAIDPPQVNVVEARGLTVGEVRQLQDAIVAATKIADGVDEVVRRLKADPKMFEPVLKEAGAVKAETQSILDIFRDARLLR